jgi:hypothetical protein
MEIMEWLFREFHDFPMIFMILRDVLSWFSDFKWEVWYPRTFWYLIGMVSHGWNTWLYCNFWSYGRTYLVTGRGETWGYWDPKFLLRVMVVFHARAHTQTNMWWDFYILYYIVCISIYEYGPHLHLKHLLSHCSTYLSLIYIGENNGSCGILRQEPARPLWEGHGEEFGGTWLSFALGLWLSIHGGPEGAIPRERLDQMPSGGYERDLPKSFGPIRGGD